MRWKLALVSFLVLAGCAAPERAIVESRPEPAVRPARSVPEPVVPPASFRRAVANQTRTTTGRPGAGYWIQHATYRLEARIDPATKLLEGSGRIVYTNNSPDTLRKLHLELVQNFHSEGAVRVEFADVTGGVELIRMAVDGDELFTAELSEEGAPSYQVTGTNLAIAPPSPVPPGGSVTIDAEWAFIIPQKGAGARMGHEGGNLIFGAYWYPVMSVYDDVNGWNTEQFMGTAEFYQDFADYDVTIEFPAGWIVAATGELRNADAVLAPAVLERMRRAHESDEPMEVVGPQHFGTSVTRGGRSVSWHFTAENVRDFAFSATRESIWEAARTPVGDRDGDGRTDYSRINTFYRESAPLWSEVTRHQQHVITFLSEHTGYPYPWPHMTAVEGGGIIGGGMEFPMMTLMGDYNARGDSALYHVTAHELGHMWIPLLVNTNERRFSWIDEGFTTFNENVAREDYFPGIAHYRDDQDVYTFVARGDAEGEMMRHSGYHTTPLAFGVASYAKPAVVLVALREVLGEEIFNRAFRTIVDEWAYKHPYPWDFFNTFERVAVRDLDWFWRSWYYETWTLDQAVASVQARGGETTIVIEDQGLVPMPVLLEIELASGDVLERRVPVDVWLTGVRTTAVTLDTPSPVVRVSIDPNRRFPDVDRSDNVWRALIPTGSD